MLKRLLLTFLLFPTLVFAQVSIYISPNGTGDGTSSATPTNITAAMGAINSYRLTDNVTIYAAAGIYRPESKLTFGTTHSGANGFKVRWIGPALGEKAVISGGTAVTGWTLHNQAKNIYVASVPIGTLSRQLFVNGKRATRSRLTTGMTSLAKTTTTQYTDNGNLLSPVARPTDLEFVIQYYRWEYSYFAVQTKTSTNQYNFNTVALAPGKFSALTTNPLRVENAYEFLNNTTLGHWYLNSSTGQLFYVPLAGENMATATAILPDLETVVEFDSTAADIEFHNFTFAHTGWTKPTTDGAFYHVQASVYFGPEYDFMFTEGDPITMPPPAVYVDGQRIKLINCLTTRTGGSGVRFGLNSDDGEYTGVVNDIGANGIIVGDLTNLAVPTTVATNIKVHGTTISNCGVDYPGSVGYFLGWSLNAILERSTIHSLTYSAISLGWGWGQPGVAEALDGAIIRKNKIYNTMNLLGDGGVIYTLGAQGDSVIEDNFIYAAGSGSNKADAHFFYLDEGTGGITVQRNLALRNLAYEDLNDNWLNINMSSNFNWTGDPIFAYTNYIHPGLEINVGRYAGDPENQEEDPGAAYPNPLNVLDAGIEITGWDMDTWPAGAKTIALGAGVPLSEAVRVGDQITITPWTGATIYADFDDDTPTTERISGVAFTIPEGAEVLYFFAEDEVYTEAIKGLSVAALNRLKTPTGIPAGSLKSPSGGSAGVMKTPTGLTL